VLYGSYALFLLTCLVICKPVYDPLANLFVYCMVFADKMIRQEARYGDKLTLLQIRVVCYLYKLGQCAMSLPPLQSDERERQDLEEAEGLYYGQQ